MGRVLGGVAWDDALRLLISSCGCHVCRECAGWLAANGGRVFLLKGFINMLTYQIPATILLRVRNCVKVSDRKNMPINAQIRLAKLRHDYEAAKAQMQALGYIIPGTLLKRKYHCGKPNCRCTTQNDLHGTYYQWTRKVSGKTVSANFDKKAVHKVKEWIKNHQCLRKLCRRLEKTSLALLETDKNMNNT